MADVGRRPLRANEQVHAARLGVLIANTRRALDMTQAQLALAADLSRTHLARLESGTRRTRRSTLRRLAAVFVVEVPKLGPVERLVDDFVREAGPALAEESVYAERVARRRATRADRAHRDAVRADELRLFAFLYEEEYGPRRWLRSDAELEELRVEMWAMFASRQGELQARRRRVEQAQRNA